MISIYLIDDDFMILNCLETFFEDRNDIQLTGKAKKLQVAIAEIRINPVDVILLDMNLMDGNPGMQNFKTLRRNFPDIPIIILTGDTDDFEECNLMKTGASAYLCKGLDTTEEKLPKYILQVAQGEKIWSKKANSFITQNCKLDRTSEMHGYWDIIEGIAKGLSKEQIANKINQDVSTVRKKASRILDSFGVKTDAELIYRIFSKKHSIFNKI
jgi:DNA-binding NarL/FixJ family response regulator